jgi:hypothetical protein
MVNICMQVNLSRKQTKVGPYYVRKSRLSTTKPTPLDSYPPLETYRQRSMAQETRGGRLTPPWSADQWASPISPSSDVDPPMTLRINLHHALKLVWIGGSRWSCDMDSLAHRMPGDPYKRTPDPL